MKKKIFGGLAILAIVAAAVWNVNISSKNVGKLSDASLSNVEVLAQAESILCPNGCYPNGPGCTCNGWNPCELEAGTN